MNKHFKIFKHSDILLNNVRTSKSQQSWKENEGTVSDVTN